jgi:precorrin-6B methylase 2
MFSLIRHQGIIPDVGANIGMMTVLFARHFEDSKVIAFEPIPLNVRVSSGTRSWRTGEG